MFGISQMQGGVGALSSLDLLTLERWMKREFPIVPTWEESA